MSIDEVVVSVKRAVSVLKVALIADPRRYSASKESSSAGFCCAVRRAAKAITMKADVTVHRSRAAHRAAV